MKNIYSVRSAIYSLLILSSLLFLINIKALGIDLSFYLIILGILVFATINEFLFSIKYSSKLYHKAHPLKDLYNRIIQHHLYNIILLPVVQYICCALIIYYNTNTVLSMVLSLATAFLTYFTLVAYSQIYDNNLKISNRLEEFFDASKYISFAYIVYLLFLLHTIFLIPRSFVSLSIGFIQLVYILSAVWRRDKFNLSTVFISIFSGMYVTTFVYLHLINNSLIDRVGLIVTSVAYVVLIDYVITSLLIRFVEKRLTITAFIEYVLITLIGITLLIFSR